MDKVLKNPGKSGVKVVCENRHNRLAQHDCNYKGVKKEFILKGLDCANCAAKIERELNHISGVDSAIVDFASSKLFINMGDTLEQVQQMEKVKQTVKRVEPEVELLEVEGRGVKAEEHEEKSGKTKFIRLGISAGIFLAALIFRPESYLNAALYFIAYLLAGGEVILKALKNIVRGEIFDENFLMVVATVGAFSIGQYPEGVAVMLFYQLGEIFQDMAVEKSRKSITKLMDIRPDFANLKTNGEIKKVSPEEVSIGDIIVVKPGERVPIDGVVVEGTSMIDTSALTGESVPRKVGFKDDVLGGVINKNGVITLEVKKEFGDSTIAKILDLVENASSKKAPTENFITKFARYYTPIVVFAAVALAVIPPFFIGASFSQWLYRALAFLVVSCPCALVISIPLGFFGGIGGASKNGILVKGGNYLEALNNVETVVFDKTGTLTKGVFKVTEVKAQNDFSEDKLLTYAAYAESYSNHPIAVSILKEYGKKIPKNLVKNYEEIAGKGIRVDFNGEEILAGNFKLMESEKVSFDKIETLGTVVYVVVNKIYAGSIVISDEIKNDSKKAIEDIKSIGIKKTVMLTGDSKKVASKIGMELGMDEIHAELLPDQKVMEIEAIAGRKSSKGKLVFVGDGINDAPVLARADIGIAMGGVGSDAAIEAADVVIMTDEPSKIATAIKIGKKTRKIVMENIIFALGVKLILLILVAIGIGTMWEAVFGDVGVTLIAVLNSMRAMKTEKI